MSFLPSFLHRRWNSGSVDPLISDPFPSSSSSRSVIDFSSFRELIRKDQSNNNHDGRFRLSNVTISSDLTFFLSDFFRLNPDISRVSFSWTVIEPLQLATLISSLMDLPSLTLFDMSFASLSLIAVELFSPLLKDIPLLGFALTHSSLCDQGIRLLFSTKFSPLNSCLVSLDLRNNLLGPQSAVALANALQSHPSLQILDLSHNRLANDGILYLTEALLSLSSLRSLNLTSNKFFDAGTLAISNIIRKSSQIEFLSISQNKIGSAGMAALAASLIHNTSVRQLNLSACMLNAADAEQLADLLRINTTLYNLDVSRNIIGWKGASLLADGLAINSGLDSLDISSQKLGHECGIAIADALRRNFTLRYLNLSACCLTTFGISLISEALVHHVSLTFLDISLNSCAMDETIATLLPANSSLRSLLFNSNSLWDAEKVNVFFSNLCSNTTLEVLELAGNQLEVSSVAPLATFIATNTNLSVLDLHGNPGLLANIELLNTAFQNNFTLQIVNLNDDQVRAYELRNQMNTSSHKISLFDLLWAQRFRFFSEWIFPETSSC